MKYIVEQKYKHKNGYNAKPKATLLKIVRTCIGRGVEGGCCGKTFMARGRFNRLCPSCTKWVEKHA